uniref:C2H2-type domain-containing protein n=1 Tax=Ascaris lumbricoides TaxID=6252 RepID=A0A0M3IF52_ASCLU
MLMKLLYTYLALKTTASVSLNCNGDEYFQKGFSKGQAQSPIRSSTSPCIQTSKVDGCIAYDSRLQARTIEEALHTFPILSSYDFASEPLVDDELTSSPSGDEYSCESIECHSCGQAISAALNASTHHSRSHPESNDHVVVNNSFCEQLLFRRLENVRSLNVTNSPTAKETRIGFSHGMNTISANDNHRTNGYSSLRVLGKAVRIGQTYKRGDEVEDGWVGLCSLSWQWRMLPPDYFPRLINEVDCDRRDSSCVEGMGSCRPVYQSLNILQNCGTKQIPIWLERTVDRIASCECRIRVGSFFHAIVAKP